MPDAMRRFRPAQQVSDNDLRIARQTFARTRRPKGLGLSIATLELWSQRRLQWSEYAGETGQYCLACLPLWEIHPLPFRATGVAGSALRSWLGALDAC